MALSFEASSLRPGLVILGRYELVRELGRGGMGVVWLVNDRALGMEVAFKFLPDVLRQDRSSLDELRDEARRNLRLTNESIVRTYDFVEDGAIAGITMEFVDGETLAARKADAPNRILEVAFLAPLVRDLCSALHYAHTYPRVVHRDLKPANLMVTRGGQLKITDFGIARTITDSVTRVSNGHPSSGTLVYMSPQQLMGEPPRPSDDIYSIGATLYDLLAGKPPFHTGSIAAQLLQSTPPTIAERRAQLEFTGASIPAAWEETIAACLSKDPQKRPATALEIIQRIEAASPARAINPEEAVTESFISIAPMQRLAPVPPTAPSSVPPTRVPAIPETTRVPAPPDVQDEGTTVRGTLVPSPTPPPSRIPVQSVPAQSTPQSPGVTTDTAPDRRNVWMMVSLVLVLVLLIGGGIVAFLARDRFAATPTPAPQPIPERPTPTPVPVRDGRLIVNTLPSGARVRVDNQNLGTTPLTLKNLAAGSYRIHLEHDNYEPLDLEVEVVAGQSTDPGILHLLPAPKKEPAITPAPTPEIRRPVDVAPVVPVAPVAAGLSDAAAREVMVRHLQATESRDLKGLLACYTNPVDYFDEGNLSQAKLSRSLRTYIEMWPGFDIQLIDATVSPTGDPDEKIVAANYRFVAKNGVKISSGIAHDVMTIRHYDDGNFIRRIRQTVTDRRKNF